LVLLSGQTPETSQVKIDVRLEKPAYLAGEPVFVLVDVRNVGPELISHGNLFGCGNVRLAVTGVERRVQPNIGGCYVGVGWGFGCSGSSGDRLAPGESRTSRYLLKDFDLIPGKYELTVSGTVPLSWYGRPGQVPGAEFQGVLSLNVQASTEAGLRAALGPLVSDANAPDHEQRRQARAGIIESAPPFLDSLIASFATDDFLGFAAVDALGRIATPASRGLLRDLYRLDKETRGSGVVLALARIAHPDEAAFFETVLGDATVDGLSRQYAALGLGRIGGDRVVKQLARALTVASADARPWIATALGNTRSREAVPVLIGMWGDAPSQDFVCGALRTLTHQHWCEGTANPPAQKQAEWTRRWKDTGAKAPIFGPDDCPTDLVFGTTLDPRSRQPRPLP
jgi:hypothetical protein